MSEKYKETNLGEAEISDRRLGPQSPRKPAGLIRRKGLRAAGRAQWLPRHDLTDSCLESLAITESNSDPVTKRIHKIVFQLVFPCRPPASIQLDPSGGSLTSSCMVGGGSIATRSGKPSTDMDLHTQNPSSNLTLNRTNYRLIAGRVVQLCLCVFPFCGRQRFPGIRRSG